MKLEIACFNLESAVIAQQAGADRIELCAGLAEGGITPDDEIIMIARKEIMIPLYVMIRIRGGNFVYSDVEFEEMKNSIEFCLSVGIDGVVFGILTSDFTVDIHRNKTLVELASPMKCTFHRAFDAVTNKNQGLEDVINCGFTNILTSGGERSAFEGIKTLSNIIILARERINIIPGGGIRSDNIKAIDDKLEAEWYHSSALTDSSGIANKDEIIALKKNSVNLCGSPAFPLCKNFLLHRGAQRRHRGSRRKNTLIFVNIC